MSWYCRSGEDHSKCKGFTIKSGLGAVEKVACGCSCHKGVKK
jgi:hypothetical protein